MDHAHQQQTDGATITGGAGRRANWSSSPIPPFVWGAPSVEPVHEACVRVLAPRTPPSSSSSSASSSPDTSNQEGDEYGGREADDAASDNQDEDDDVCTETQALARCELVAPQPRRVVSPELIFSSAAESLVRHKRLRLDDPDSSLPFYASWSKFRPIVAERPDVESTSPPMRAANPVVMDARFQDMKKWSSQHKEDAVSTPVQPFYPRASRRIARS
ncbi:hypothetical protein FI667_g4245, partial [Globisporangium splendens]